jgi:hypothetical protein
MYWGRLMNRWMQIVALLAMTAMPAMTAPASATVVFGHDVYIGGHDFSYQAYDRQHRGVIYLYDRTPPHPGCRWTQDGRGGYVKVCHLRRLNRP